MTLDFVSEAGSFRLDWVTKNPKGLDSSFLLTLRSSFSGRPLKVIVNHRGAGFGSVEFADEPRLYEFLAASSGLEWSVTVVETRTARQ